MIDVNFIRQNPEKVKKACLQKGVDFNMEKFLQLDKKRREILRKIEAMRAQKNITTKEIAKIKDAKRKKELIGEMKKLDQKYYQLNLQFKKLNNHWKNLYYQIPNLPASETPVGKDESENVVLRQVGQKPQFDFPPKDYLEIAEKLDIIDVKRAAKTSGTRFGFLKNEAVLLQWAIINFVFDFLLKKGFLPVLPPVLIKPEMMWGMGYIKKIGEKKFERKEVYFLRDDDLVLVPTAEHVLGSMHANEIFKENDLPKRYVAFSSCFRREAGSYGKDTRGIFRVHQFDKIEMFSFCLPKESRKELLFFLSLEEELMKALKIPYRVLHICTGDLGDTAAEKFDIEAFLPSQNRYRETHSTSNCTDFQARRLNIKYEDKSGKLNFVHTVNGTAFALGRIIIAIIENYQQKDGSVLIPEVLRKYLDFEMIKR